MDQALDIEKNPLDDLLADIKRNQDGAITLESRELREYMQQTIWPFFEAMVDQMKEQQTAIVSLIEESDELLHAETGALLLGVIGLASELITMLQQIVARNPKSAGAQAIMQKIALFFRDAPKAVQAIEEVTIADDEEEDAPGEGGEGEGGEDDDEEDDDDDDEEDDDDDDE